MPGSTRTTHDWTGLCQTVRAVVPDAIGKDAWVWITAATLASSPDTNLLASFYLHLTKDYPEFQSEEAKSHISLRFRDILLKLITLVGAPQVLCVLIPLAKAEGNAESKSKASSLNDKWKPQNMDVQGIYERGAKTINAIYGPSLLPQIFDTWGSHKEDVRFNELFAIYGLYLSDFEVLTALETEAVVYATISCLGLGGPGNWHLRGMGRMLGARGKSDSGKNAEIKDQLKSLRRSIMTVVEFVGDDFMVRAKLEKWADVEKMLVDFNGWGDDPLEEVSNS